MEAPKSSSWPWRKKSTQTHTHVATASLKQGSETATASGNPNHERRSQSLSDTLLNKNLVQQHAQIAEEAVSGWQKAESEGARYKKQLEEALERKADAEDRLHKCVKEREEEATLRRKEWDKLTMAMEAKIAEAEQQLIAAEAENSVILTSLQERDATLALLTQGKNKSEAQVQSLYVKMTSLLKENSRLKYELHLLNKEQQIRTDDKYTRMASKLEQLRHVFPSKNLTVPASTTPFHLKSSSTTRKDDPQLGSINDYETTPADDLCKSHKQWVDEVHSEKEKVSETLESDLQVLRSVRCDVEATNDADDVSCAQSLASAMIAELDHFRRDKALMLFDHKSIDLDFPTIAIEDHLTEIESVASCSDANKTDHRRSLKQEIEIQAADRKNWSSKYARDMSDSSVIASRFFMSISEIVKLVKALAHPLLYSTTKSNKSFSENKFIQSSSELSESDLQLNIEKLEAMKEKAVDLGGSSVSWAAVDFLQVLVGVLNRLVKIALYRNAQRDGCSDDCDDHDDDMSGLASVSQQINTASFNNFLSPLPNIPSKMDFNRETPPTIRHDKLPAKIKESENQQVKSWESLFPYAEKEGVVYTPKAVGIGGHGHPSLNSKHLITPTNSSSSSSKLFHFNSSYIKTAIRSTISKTRTQSSVSSTTTPSHPHVKSKPPNKLLNRLLSFS